MRTDLLIWQLHQQISLTLRDFMTSSSANTWGFHNKWQAYLLIWNKEDKLIYTKIVSSHCSVTRTGDSASGYSARLVTRSSPGRSGGRIFFSRVNFLCWLILVSILLIHLTYFGIHPVLLQQHVKNPSPFVKKCKWQVTAKTRMHPTHVALHEVMWHYGAWLYSIHRMCHPPAM